MTEQKKGSRRGGRRRAFEVLYSLNFNEVDSKRDLEKMFRLAPAPSEEAAERNASERKEFAWELVSGVWEHNADIDKKIDEYSQHWKLSRIARIELTILRLALFEMLYVNDVPLKVAINEAIELAKRFGDDNSKNFVNGILDAVAKAIENGQLRVR
ncbi:transcription antitermination factor NusB [Desulfobaculum bizertense]|uniref:Transcription antitermination protein NusB n=1 Tax=Desulfobaculum bizertense DSM 18034 TaxID=1121442 RepID=A0A1T4VE09_9BACT|nr:transcription antitermination factor NusB [Desulfobaculum bizertense]UIJ37644.1 transcription antitermination factor NusB [Desulfobaculum bizertense]SKA63192.1 NusB antitermination factor [Desulfobaculum bizertense DSM 18034]